MRSRLAGAAVATACLLAFLALLELSRTFELFDSILRTTDHGLIIGAGFLLGATTLGGVVPPIWRRATLLVVSALAYPFLLGLGALPFAGFAIALCAVARWRVLLRYQLLAGMTLWAALPISRVWLWPDDWQRSSVLLVYVWTGLAYATVYLLVERRRAQVTTSWVDELLYLFALPRLMAPFFQPIPLSRFCASDTEPHSIPHALRGLALGVYGAALAAGLALVVTRADQVPMPWRVAVHFAGIYCMAAHQIFISIALYRLMGFDLPSGFRRPFAARSFADFFRRWNHYVRDAVLSLFFFPLLGWLRTRLPPKVATILAAYAAIFAGSFLMNDLLVPVACAHEELATAAMSSANPVRMLTLVVYWSAIVVPAVLVPRRKDAPAWHRWRDNALFLVALFAIWFVAGTFGGDLFL